MPKIIIYSDGGARGNPGPAGVGVVVLKEGGKVLTEGNLFLGETTNNEAEYQAVLLGLVTVKTLFNSDEIKMLEIEQRLDSELVVKQLRGDYKIKEPRLRDWALKVKEMVKQFKRVSWTHVPREQNKRADELANEAMDAGPK